VHKFDHKIKRKNQCQTTGKKKNLSTEVKRGGRTRPETRKVYNNPGNRGKNPLPTGEREKSSRGKNSMQIINLTSYAKKRKKGGKKAEMVAKKGREKRFSSLKGKKKDS